MQVRNFDFPLTGSPGSPSANGAGAEIELRLDDEAFTRKIAAARAYVELDAEVESAIRQNHIEAFRLECLREVKDPGAVAEFTGKPYYESYGEEQVAKGHYAHVIRFGEHFLPLVQAMARCTL